MLEPAHDRARPTTTEITPPHLPGAQRGDCFGQTGQFAEIRGLISFLGNQGRICLASKKKSVKIKKKHPDLERLRTEPLLANPDRRVFADEFSRPPISILDEKRLPMGGSNHRADALFFPRPKPCAWPDATKKNPPHNDPPTPISSTKVRSWSRSDA